MATVLFDGTCNFCNAAVRVIVSQDPKKIYRFASLQSTRAAEFLAPFGLRAELLDSIVLIDGDRLYQRSDAALRIAAELRAPLTFARFFLAVPKPLRDHVYDWIARNRYRVFGRRDVCALPDPTLADRFL
jgi:predicted DCC family thiol-disulfide oxidoreductase YuxK